eukprot:m.512641 g.512641  ORF g.512641 m.512641 type:complete len:75 (+) comp105691_c0_seq1:91-315(+)
MVQCDDFACVGPPSFVVCAVIIVGWVFVLLTTMDHCVYVEESSCNLCFAFAHRGLELLALGLVWFECVTSVVLT